MGTSKAQRILIIAIMAVVAAAPFAIPVPWVAMARWMAGGALANPDFLPAPRANQAWFVSFASATAGIMAAIWGNWQWLRLKNGRLNLVALAGCSWFIYSLLRGILAPWAGVAYETLILQGAFFLLFLAGLSSKARGTDIYRLQVALAGVAILLAIMALMQNAGYDPLPYSQVTAGTGEDVAGKHLIASTFGHPNYMGSFLAPVVVLSVGLVMDRARMGVKVLGCAAAVLGTMAMVVGGTRGPILALLAGLVALIFLRPGSMRQVMRVLLVGIGAVWLLALAMWLIPAVRPSFDITDRLFAGKEVASRVYYWVIGLEMFGQAPVFGVGLGQFNEMFWESVARSSTSKPGGAWNFVLDSVIRGVRPGHMHNDHLQVLVEGGLVGAAIWVCLWGGIIDRMMNLRGQEEQLPGTRVANAACFGAFTAVAVDALFGFPLHLPCSGTLFWVLLGLWAGANRETC